MRKSKYGVSPKAVASALLDKGLDCSERSAQGALKKYAEDGTRFTSARVAADIIASYKREYGCYPRVAAEKRHAPASSDTFEREVGHAVLLLHRLGFKVEVS